MSERNRSQNVKKWVVSHFHTERAITGNVFHDAEWLIEEYIKRGAEIYLNERGDTVVVYHPAYGVVDNLCVVDIYGRLLDPSPM